MAISLDSKGDQKRLFWFERAFYFAWKYFKKNEIAKILILAVVYFSAARFGLSLAVSVEQVTLIWPPTGIALVALLLYGFRLWPGIVIGAFFANILAHEPFLVALGIAASNTLTAIAGVYILKYFNFLNSFERLTDVGLIFLVSLLTPLISASLGALNLVWGNLVAVADYWRVWLNWWIGDGMGILIVAPLLLAWLRKENRALLAENKKEAFLLIALTVSVASLIFVRTPDFLLSYPRGFIVFPLIMWATIRFTQVGAASANFLIAFIAVWGTTLGKGPFVVSASVETDLRVLLTYIFTFTTTSLVAAAVITRGRRAEEQTHFQLYHDVLTLLPNTRWFNEQLDRRLKENLDPLAVFVLDVDRFKVINDSFGHFYGDKVLQAVGIRLKEALAPPNDYMLARSTGDEFVFCLNTIRGNADVAELAQKILDSFRSSFHVYENELFASLSIGISLFPEDGRDVSTLLKNADAAMYRAKDQHGGNNYQFYSASFNSTALEKLTLEGALRRAVEKSEFEIYYQPQVDLLTGRVVRNEALIRWHRPNFGLTLPGEFIELAEETGMINQIAEFTIKQAIRQTAAWHRSGIKTGVAVNLSARQFQEKNLLNWIKKFLKEEGLPGRYLELEVTERILMENADHVINLLQELKAMDITISIDDFNTGYSSLNYIKQFPIDILKIDRSFVGSIPDNPNDCAIAQSIIQLAHSLGKIVTAEGIESKEQLEFLIRQGCDRAQGYLFSQPLSPAECFDFLRNKPIWIKSLVQAE